MPVLVPVGELGTVGVPTVEVVALAAEPAGGAGVGAGALADEGVALLVGPDTVMTASTAPWGAGVPLRVAVCEVPPVAADDAATVALPGALGVAVGAVLLPGVRGVDGTAGAARPCGTVLGTVERAAKSVWPIGPGPTVTPATTESAAATVAIEATKGLRGRNPGRAPDAAARPATSATRTGDLFGSG